jgi:sporulation-control protein spo0M
MAQSPQKTGSTIDLFQARLDEVNAQVEKDRKALDKLGEQLRNDRGNEGLTNKYRDMSDQLNRLTDEQSDLARSVAAQAGGKNYAPPA